MQAEGRSLVKYRRAAAVAVAVALAAGIFFLREALDNPNEGVTLLYVIPIAIVAIEFGGAAGMAAAAASLALYGVWDSRSADVNVGPLGYAVRGLAFGLLGGLLGRFASERRRLIEQLRRLSHEDALTGLFNRHRFQEELDRERARVRRHGGQSALVFFDLDGLKRINDGWGHQAGDEVLRMVARVLRDQLRPTDVAARFGGDEFLVLLSGADGAAARTAAGRLLRALRRASIVVAGERLSVTASVGAILFDAATPLTSEQLLDAADHAMYSIKRTGGGGVVIRHGLQPV